MWSSGAEEIADEVEKELKYLVVVVVVAVLCRGRGVAEVAEMEASSVEGAAAEETVKLYSGTCQASQ